MIFKATYSDPVIVISEITFAAQDLTEALIVLCSTHMPPPGADRVNIEPLPGEDARDRG